MEHIISKIDAQPSSLSEASLLVLVIGELKVLCFARTQPFRIKFILCLQVDDGEYPLKFSQVFQLIPEGGSYYVYVYTNKMMSHSSSPDRLNDIFRLNLG